MLDAISKGPRAWSVVALTDRSYKTLHKNIITECLTFKTEGREAGIRHSIKSSPPEQLKMYDE